MNEDDDDDILERAKKARADGPHLNTKQAAHFLRLSCRTLEKLRCTGGGPKFRKFGNQVRYHIDDLIEWSAARIHVITRRPTEPDPGDPPEGE